MAGSDRPLARSLRRGGVRGDERREATENELGREAHTGRLTGGNLLLKMTGWRRAACRRRTSPRAGARTRQGEGVPLASAFGCRGYPGQGGGLRHPLADDFSLAR